MSDGNYLITSDTVRLDRLSQWLRRGLCIVSEERGVIYVEGPAPHRGYGNTFREALDMAIMADRHG